MSLSRKLRPQSLCLLCQWRTFSTTARRLAQEAAKAASATTATSSPPKPPPKKFVPPSPLADAPRSYGKRVESFEPKPLTRPIGMAYPPEPGQNTGLDFRTWKQRHADFTNWDKHLARRQELKSKMARPYFRDWSNMQYHKGKTFIAPPRVFRGELALWFPNLYGTTLEKGEEESLPRDTTPTLAGRVSVVSLFSSRWAESQARTFASEEGNPGLMRLLEEHRERCQLVRINYESDGLKALMIKMFMSALRKEVGERNWGRYFVVRKGISDEIRESIGFLNSKVGYTYLLDGECRIRWAASGDAEEGEREGLMQGVKRLLHEEEREKGITGIRGEK